jgi:hypothetical protein
MTTLEINIAIVVTMIIMVAAHSLYQAIRFRYIPMIHHLRALRKNAISITSSIVWSAICVYFDLHTVSMICLGITVIGAVILLIGDILSVLNVKFINQGFEAVIRMQ